MRNSAMEDRPALPARAVVLGPGEGRGYEMPTMRAVFKADGVESGGRFSASEWWLAPDSAGPGPHSHADNDEVFYVTEGTVSIRVGDIWVEAEQGAFVLIPAGVTHDFKNRSDRRAGLFNVFLAGTFERDMPAIVEWYARAKRA